MWRIFFPGLLVVACNSTPEGKGNAPALVEDTDTDNTGAQEADADADADADTDADADADTDPDPDDIDGDGDGYTPNQGDCDDEDAAINPGAPELCDDIDNDCNGESDNDFDTDADGLKDCLDNCPIQVSVGAASGGDGTFAAPFQSIQVGIDAAPVYACYEVEVAAGTYFENLNYNGIDVNVYAKSDYQLTIIDGQLLDSVVTFENAETSDARLAGFIIQNGSAEQGAGIYVDTAGPTIEGNTITDNVTSSGKELGGGIRTWYGDTVILDNVITNNDAGYGGPEDGCDGGGVNIRSGNPIVMGNIIASNTAGDGGGIWLAYGGATIVNNTIYDNEAMDSDASAGGQGGGINVQIGSSTMVLSANLILGNTASTHGGGVAIYEYSASAGDVTLSNNVVAWNEITDTVYGAGIATWGLTKPTLLNNIVYQNVGEGVWLNDATTFKYNDVYGNTTAYAGELSSQTGLNGNVAVDPLFTGVSNDGVWTNDDWTLRSTSTLINAGSTSITDVDGSRSDMGAYGGPYGVW